MDPFFYEQKDENLYIDTVKALTKDPHMHRHLELICMLEGSCGATVNSKYYNMNAGEAFIAFPNQIHFYDQTEPITCMLMIFSPDYCREFSRQLTTRIPSAPICKLSDEALHAARQIDKIKHNASKYQDELLKGNMLILLSEILKVLELKPVSDRFDSVIPDLLNYCSQNFRGDMSLSAVSSKLNISKFYISHIFAQKTGISFSDYITTLRLQDACFNLIYSDMSVTEAAYSSGFSSIRSFNRLFLKNIGTTPSLYRRQNKNEHA